MGQQPESIDQQGETMNRERRVTVTITRVIDIDVTVRHVPGIAPTWWEPGEPDETIIEAAIDDDGEPVELTESEAREAAHAAIETPEDHQKPF